MQVKQGDVIEVDSILKSNNGQQDGDTDSTKTVRRGRVMVKEIGPLTRKGRHKLLLVRHKHFKIFKIFESE